MIGFVDQSGRALVTLSVRAAPDAEPTQCPAWIDTAFNGELVLPRSIIAAAELKQVSRKRGAQICQGFAPIGALENSWAIYRPESVQIEWQKSRRDG